MSDVVDLTLDSGSNRTLWVNRDGAIFSVEPGGRPRLDAKLDCSPHQAKWQGQELLYRSEDAVGLWSAENGTRVLGSGLPGVRSKEGLAFHPRGLGHFYLRSNHTASYLVKYPASLFRADSDIVRLKTCEKGDFLGLMSGSGLQVFQTETCESMGAMSDAIGDWLLWDDLLICQVDNPKGEGLMVVDLREGRLIQGGPSGYRVIEQFQLSSSKEWLFGVSPAQKLIVGWYMDEGWSPEARWEHPIDEGIIDALALPEDQLLVFKRNGESVVLNSMGETTRTLPLHFQGTGARLLTEEVVGSVDGSRIHRWSLSNGEGVAYS
jgi:hypothetical protein